MEEELKAQIIACREGRLPDGELASFESNFIEYTRAEIRKSIRINSNIDVVEGDIHKFVATNPIPKGTIIIREKALCESVPIAADAIEKMFQRLLSAYYDTLPYSHYVCYCLEKMYPRTDKDFLECFEHVVIEKEGKEKKLTPEEALQDDNLRLMMKFYCNCFASGGNLFLLYKSSYINHSCVPNSSLEWMPTGNIVQITALVDIKAGEEITISYIDPKDIYIQNTKERQDTIAKRFAFICECSACMGTSKETPAQYMERLLREYRLVHVCGYCKEPATDRCSRCHQINYCSRRCQAAHWSTHKNICRTLKKL